MTARARSRWLSGLWWALFLAHAAWIFWLSSGPLPAGISLPDWPGSDKLAHALQFGLLALLGLQAVRPSRRRSLWWVVWVSWLYGLSDEVHQVWVPGRQADWSDWLADGLGIGIAAWLWARWRAGR